MSAVERGQLERLTLGTIRQIGSALEVTTPLAPRWRGVALPRLLDARHAALVDEVVARLSVLGWQTVLEYTFQHFGEKGSIDVLAWRPDVRALLLIEVKPDLDDLQDMLSTIDRKARLVPRLVAAERGWLAGAVGILLVMPECSTSRWQVSRHAAISAASFPARNHEVRRWLEAPGWQAPKTLLAVGAVPNRPSQPKRPALPAIAARPTAERLRGVWFLQETARATRMESAARGGGSRRVRVPQTEAGKAQVGAAGEPNSASRRLPAGGRGAR